MTGPTRVAALAAAVALAACTGTTPPASGALLNEPTALAFFRGVTIKSGLDSTGPYPYRPYIAIANAGSNDLSILDGADDSLVRAPALLRGLVYPVPGRPVLLASADLGDVTHKPDLLVVVTAGDSPTGGGSQLEVIRTWAADGAIVGPPVDLGADILALVSLPPDPANPGTAQLVAALAGERIAVVTFTRSTAGDGTGIDPSAATIAVSDPLGFQPMDLALVPGDRAHVYAASHEPLPGGVLGVAEVNLTGTPAFGRALNANAPTRLVAGALLAESDELRDLSSAVAAAWDETAFTDASLGFAPRPTVGRVYAVLDESGCGLQAAIGCGIVAIDPVTGDLLPDPTPSGTFHAPFLAPIAIPGIQALATSIPRTPQFAPDPLDPQYAVTWLRIAVSVGFRQTTAAAGVASADGVLNFVDLARWDTPSEQSAHENVRATVASSRPAGTPGSQWIVLQGPGGPVSHLDAAGLTTSVAVTAGYTPTDTWTVGRESVLPNLTSRRAEPGYDGTPSIALQQTSADGSVAAAVRLWDPMLGVHAGDTVVLEPSGLGTCGPFEATVTELVAPDLVHPGGWVRLGHRVLAPGTPAVPAATLAGWNGCVDQIPTARPATGGPFFAATFRAGEYVLVRGTGTAALHVGRPQLGVPFTVEWQDETPLAATCLLPPAAPWTDPRVGTVPSCDPGSACRDACELLLRVRLARRTAYVPELPADLTGPALRFTLALEQPSQPVYRDMGLTLTTSDGKVPFRVGTTVGSPTDARAVVPFDRSPWSNASGIRFLVPFAGGIVLDGTPTLPGVAASNTIF